MKILFVVFASLFVSVAAAQEYSAPAPLPDSPDSGGVLSQAVMDWLRARENLDTVQAAGDREFRLKYSGELGAALRRGLVEPSPGIPFSEQVLGVIGGEYYRGKVISKSAVQVSQVAADANLHASLLIAAQNARIIELLEQIARK